MTTTNNGGPAFPFGQISESTGQPVNGFYDPGMSLRDYFAAKALQGICATNPSKSWADERIADEAYRMADAMLKAREEE